MKTKISFTIIMSNNNGNLLLSVAIIALIIYIIYVLYPKAGCCQSGESFWGGVMPVPYLGQPLKTYERTGIDAATDAPKMFVNFDSCPINPYCANCKGYP